MAEEGYKFADEQPFKRKHLEIKKETINLRVTEEDKELLRTIKPLIQQDKDSTCIKQCALIGANVLLGKPTAPLIIGFIKDNVRRNKRIGINEVE